MLKPSLPVNESSRLRALHELSILDTLPEDDLDNLTRLASVICNTPIALITLVDSQRQWFKSKVGLDVPETPRDVAFCAHAIVNPDEMLIVQDSRKDERFFDNPLVTGYPHVIFYGGVPLLDEDGHALGTICVIDHKSNSLSPEQREGLKALARQVVKIFELRKANSSLKKLKTELETRNKELEAFANRAAHDLKSPLSQIVHITDMLEEEYSSGLEKEARELISYLKISSVHLSKLITGILNHSRSEIHLQTGKENINFTAFIRDVISYIGHHESAEFILPEEEAIIIANRVALEQIFMNLVSNAIKYNDKDRITIEIGFTESDSSYCFYVKDNGRGISVANYDKIFEIFTVLASNDRFGEPSTGIGLATVKNLVEKLGGHISVSSEDGVGSTFRFSIPK